MIRCLILIVLFTARLHAQINNETSSNLSDSTKSSENNEERFYNRKDVGFVFGMGISSGGDYGDVAKTTLTSQGYSVSGFWGFINIEAGFDCRIKGNLFLYPHIRWMWHRISTQNSFGGTNISGNDRFNSIFLFGAAARYLLINIECHSMYISADLGSVSASWDISDFSPTSDGLQKGVSLGYQYNNGSIVYAVELGYISIPMKFETRYTAPYPPHLIVHETISKNFGGVIFNFSMRVPLFNYSNE